MAPLQTYSSAMMFTPDNSMVRRIYEKEMPSWIISGPHVETDWDPALQSLEGHSDWVRAVAFSPDGKLVASASYDSIVRLWDADTGTSLSTLEGHSSPVLAVVFSPDGKLVASTSRDSTIRLWDADTGASRSTLAGHSNAVNAVAFSPDGKLVASASGDSTVRLWDAETGASRSTLEGHSGSVRVVAFSPDGKLVASASGDSTIRLWETNSGSELHCITATGVRKLAFCSGGSYLSTNWGDIAIATSLEERESNDRNRVQHLFVEDVWVKFKEEKLLWLPHEYRPTSMAYQDNMLALGRSSGRVSFIKIDALKLST